MCTTVAQPCAVIGVDFSRYRVLSEQDALHFSPQGFCLCVWFSVYEVAFLGTLA